jgi:acyl carrier protein phosphodiesterase
MNWLAHVYLSEQSPAFRVGNLLPDFMSMPALAALPEQFQPGIQQHRRIDAFTDSHPIVKQSIQRFEAPFRRFGGILCDVFYDHFLANDWHQYSEVPLPDFTYGFYDSIESLRPHLPADIHFDLRRMRHGDLLGSYRDLSGITQALQRLSRRFRRPVDLAPAMSVLERHYDSFRADFRAFFPELQAHVGLTS